MYYLINGIRVPGDGAYIRRQIIKKKPKIKVRKELITNFLGINMQFPIR